MAVKVYGVRIEEDLIKDFNEALKKLPLALKSGEVIGGHMRQITDNINSFVSGETTVCQIRVGNDDFIFHRKDGVDSLLFNGSVSEIKHDDF